MAKRVVVLIIFAACLLGQNVNADEYMVMYMEPPDVKYETLGKISAMHTLDDIESVILQIVGRKLQRKAYKMGGNALIIGSMSRFAKVIREEPHQNMAPALPIYYLMPWIELGGTAIKIENSK